MLPQDPRRYWAFISYSHHDSRIAADLHVQLESYRLPRHLVGRQTAKGIVPQRLQPIFRDRDELPSSSELGAVIRQALSDSRHLIVICSPHAANSRWVEEEIRLFKAMGGGDRILALIVDGEPNAANPAHECFPPSLRQGDPIAADLRKTGDGAFLARMKLISGLLGLGLDELVRREQRRQRQQRLIRFGAFAAALMAATLMYVTQQRVYERRDQLEQRRQLVEHGRRELLAGAPMRAAVYLAEAYRRGDDTLALRYMLHRAMQPIDALRQVLDNRGMPWRSFLTEDDALLTVVSEEGWIDVWSLADSRRIARIEDSDIADENANKRFDPALSHDRQFVAAAAVSSKTQEASLSVWSLADQRRVLKVPVDVFNCASVQPFGPDGQLLVIAPGGKPTLWSLTDGSSKTIETSQEVTTSTFDRHGDWIALGMRSGDVELHPQHANGRRLMLSGFSSPVINLLFDDDSGRLLAASEDGGVGAWTLPDDTLLYSAASIDRVLLSQGPEGAHFA